MNLLILNNEKGKGIEEKIIEEVKANKPQQIKEAEFHASIQTPFSVNINLFAKFKGYCSIL